MSRTLFLLLSVSLWAVCMVSVTSSGNGTNSSASSVSSTHVSSNSSQLTSTTVSPDNVTTGSIIENTTLRTHEVIKADVAKFPYRVCSMAQGTDLLRFEQNIECESFKPTKEDFDEGIMVVYKRNIKPYTFKVTVYQKILTQRQSYSYIYVNYMLGQTVEHLAVPLWEVHYINRLNRCYNSVKRTMSGKVYDTYHKDSFVNETMLLLEDYSNTHTSRFVTVKELWHKAGSTWLYTTSSNVNCMVTVTTARSKYPYDFFVTSGGEWVDISPFYNGSNKKHFGENQDKFHIYKNYSMVEYYGRENVPEKTHRLMAFFQRSDSLMSWDIEDESNSTCQFTFWEQSERTIRSEAEDTYHFTSGSMTATFLSRKTPVNDSDPALECIKDEAERKLQEIFNTTYNSTYVQSGNVTVYETTGGLIVFWLPVQERAIWEMKQLADGYTNLTNATSSRQKRSVENTSELLNSDVIHNVVYAQLQFTYDTLRNYINRALRQIAEAWCKDQRRTQEVLKELSKINPTAMLSAIYDKPVAARYAGDVISLAKCVEVNQTTVQVMRDMHIKGKEKKNLCYSRPVVLFRFYNSSHVQYGQLGEHNEILLGRHRTEVCETPSMKIFIAGNTSYEYVDYVYKREIPLDTIPIINTMISLDIDPLENTDFKALELYSEDELRASNVFNLEEIMQEFNNYKQRVVHMEGKVFNDVPPYLKGLDDLMSGLGSAGKALGVAIGAVGGAVASIVDGIVGFIKNPFGSLTMILFLLAVLGVIYLIYTRQQHMYQNPVQHLFPYVAPTTLPVKETPPPPSYEESVYSSIKEKPSASSTKFSAEDAYEMLLALQRLDEEKRKKDKDSQRTVSLEGGQHVGLLDRIRNRRRGYTQVENEYEV
ncbi:envelope glycoprotein B [Cercopithecine betaherpesvirus 5]|uniref:Envelope glycoprotein B n=1 Tax=Simian cytomegalovirus (strain Colburn) TaxID=50292 RepID=G8XTW1_SCMVC|nr:envelope glycoprotein B [Cercopithecine betaherpesvirus 5]